MKKTKFSALPFRPDVWANDPLLLAYANCYTYALGDSRLLTAHMGCNPGNLAGETMRTFTTKEVVELAQKDGLAWTGDKIWLGKDFYPVALFSSVDQVDPDYHWVRMNKDGAWSQKFYDRPPSLVLSASGAPATLLSSVMRIQTPEGDVRPYEIAGFFIVPRDLIATKEEILESFVHFERHAKKNTPLTYGAPTTYSKVFADLKPVRDRIMRMRRPKIVIPKA
jgi:hypothetical protein